MNKILLLLSILLLPLSVQAQFLKAGLKAAYPVVANLETVNERSFHFADDINSEYRVSPDNNLRKRFIPFPKLFVHYMPNDNWFANYELGYLSYLKSYRIRGFTDFKSNVILDTRYDYTLLSQSVTGGYKFLRTREIRPRIYGGITHFSLLQLREVSDRSDAARLENNTLYGEVIHQYINAIRNNFFAYTIGLGLDYYMINVDVYYEHSLGSIENKQFYPLYQNYHTLSVSVGINILGMLAKSAKVKNYKNKTDQ